MGVTFALFVSLYYIYSMMYPIDHILHKENYNNSEYREKSENIIKVSREPIKELEKFTSKESSPSAFLNTAIPLIRTVQQNKLCEEHIPSAESYLQRVDRDLFNYTLTEGKMSTPFYFDATNVLVSGHLWPHWFLQYPMYFILPSFRSFKEQLDNHLQPFHNKYSRYKVLESLRTRARNSVAYLERKIDEVETYEPYLKKYCSTIKDAKSKSEDVHYIAESYLTPLMIKPVADLKGNLKGVLPLWEPSWDKLAALYEKLKGKYMDESTKRSTFFDLFSGKETLSFNSRISWIDKNPKNKVTTSSTILKLFKILAYSNCIDIRFAELGGRVVNIAHHCFLVDGKPPEKPTMTTAWSVINGTSSKYKDLQSIVNSI